MGNYKYFSDMWGNIKNSLYNIVIEEIEKKFYFRRGI